MASDVASWVQRGLSTAARARNKVTAMGLLSKLFGPSKQVRPTPVRDLEAFRATVLRSELPVIVDVWSESCAPCRKLAVVLLEIATRYDGRVRIVEISTDAEPALMAKLGVRATPTILVFDRGDEIGRMAGYRPAEWFDQMIEAELLPTDAAP